MSDLDYLLVVLTHGQSPTLAATLEQVLDRVSPPPSAAYLHLDLVPSGPLGIAEAEELLSDLARRRESPSWMLEAAPRPLGFCRSVARTWRRAVQQGRPFVFWVEHDFEFLEDVDLRQPAAVLDAEPTLAQMGLMREPVNEREAAAGGLYSLNRDRYWPRDGWLLSRTNFSTTCSLMRRDFMARNPWPDYESECEGRYSIDLLEAGYAFAVWGDGTPQLRHTGVRTGFGY